MQKRTGWENPFLKKRAAKKGDIKWTVKSLSCFTFLGILSNPGLVNG